MAEQILNVGTSANDNTGDPLRSAMIKCKSNFAELYASLAGKADLADLTAQFAEIEDSLDDINTALADKLDAADYVDPSAVQPRFDTTQTITAAERRTLATNTGGFVTFPLEILGPVIDVAGVTTYTLPRLPFDFIIHDVTLAVTLRTAGVSGTFAAGLTLDQGATLIAHNSGTAITGTGTLTTTIDAVARRLSKQLATTATVTIVSTEVSGVAKGLTLWLRGVWEN